MTWMEYYEPIVEAGGTVVFRTDFGTAFVVEGRHLVTESQRSVEWHRKNAAWAIGVIRRQAASKAEPAPTVGGEA